MRKPAPAWFSMLPGGLPPSRYSLDDLRTAKMAHAFLAERIDGPAAFGECLRAFRFLLFFGVACVAENKYPPLTRCWRDLEALFMRDPAFEDGVFVQSWVLMDFPFGPRRETALDYFEAFIKGREPGGRRDHLDRVLAHEGDDPDDNFWIVDECCRCGRRVEYRSERTLAS